MRGAFLSVTVGFAALPRYNGNAAGKINGGRWKECLRCFCFTRGCKTVPKACTRAFANFSPLKKAVMMEWLQIAAIFDKFGADVLALARSRMLLR